MLRYVRDESQITSGWLFQVRKPVTSNDLSQNEVCVRGTWSFPLSADLIPGRLSTLRLDDRTLPGTPEHGH